MAGGFFLLFKGTMELHERLEGGGHGSSSGPRVYASFWVIVTQIVVLDAVFSLDSVITAVGMVDHLAIMMIAVIIAIGIMLLASKPLTRFVNAHPTVVVLCLGFLLMIGFSLLAESFGFKVPKGYLYAAIGFSVAIEALNQLARRNLLKLDARRPMRERTAAAVLRMGKRPPADEPDLPSANAPAIPAFGVEERNMVSGVLTLAERSIRSIMTPRTDVSWINIDDDADTIRGQLIEAPHSFFPVCRGSLERGAGHRPRQGPDRRSAHRGPGAPQPAARSHHRARGHRHPAPDGHAQALARPAGAGGGRVRRHRGPGDADRRVRGHRRRIPDEDELPDIVADGERTWKIDGAADLHHVEQVLETEGLIDEAQDFSTLAGYLLSRFGHLPKPGDACEYEIHHDHFRFEVLEMDGRRIALVRVEKAGAAVRRSVPDQRLTPDPPIP